MTITSYPFGNASVAQPVTDADFAQLMMMLRETSGVVGANDCKITRTSGLGVQVALGKFFVAGTGGEVTATETVTLDAASSNPRIDYVVLRRTLTVGPTLGSVALAKVTGTPGAIPVAPTLTQVVTGQYDYPLAQILVPASASALVDGNLTDTRQQLFAPVTTADISDATAFGRSLLTAADADAALTLLGATTVGKALIRAVSAIAARETMRLFKNGASFTPAADDLKYTDL